MSNTPQLNDGIKRELFFDGKTIQKRVSELAEQINQDYKDKVPLLVGVMKGSFMFMADLVRHIDPNLKPELDFIFISSYGSGTESSGHPKIDKDLSRDITGRNVLVVEDIVDTGLSFKTLIEILSVRGLASLKTCTLLSKPARRKVEVPIDYLGFEIEDKWVEGYGLDTDELYRNLPDIWYRVG